MASPESTRVAAAHYLDRAATTCTGILQTTVQYATLTTRDLLGTQAGEMPPKGPLHWVWAAALHEMLQGMKAYLFAAHAAKRMLDENIAVDAAIGQIEVQLLPNVLTHERWLRLPWLNLEVQAEGYDILLGLHQLRKCLHRTRGVVHMQEAGKQKPLTVQLLRLSVVCDPTGKTTSQQLVVENSRRTLRDGDSIVLRTDDLAAIGLTLWVLTQRAYEAF